MTVIWPMIILTQGIVTGAYCTVIDNTSNTIIATDSCTIARNTAAVGLQAVIIAPLLITLAYFYLLAQIAFMK